MVLLGQNPNEAEACTQHTGTVRDRTLLHPGIPSTSRTL